MPDPLGWLGSGTQVPLSVQGHVNISIVMLKVDEALHSSVALKKNFVELRLSGVQWRTLLSLNDAKEGLPPIIFTTNGLFSGSSPSNCSRRSSPMRAYLTDGVVTFGGRFTLKENANILITITTASPLSLQTLFKFVLKFLHKRWENS